jgi:hypothetical protein
MQQRPAIAGCVDLCQIYGLWRCFCCSAVVCVLDFFVRIYLPITRYIISYKGTFDPDHTNPCFFVLSFPTSAPGKTKVLFIGLRRNARHQQAQAANPTKATAPRSALIRVFPRYDATKVPVSQDRDVCPFPCLDHPYIYITVWTIHSGFPSLFEQRS